jgi:uncharacterized alkaline shock family protein YloU
MKKTTSSHAIPTVTADTNSLGEVTINHDVIKRIVHLSCVEVPGVHSVGGSFSFSDLFSNKSSSKGIRISDTDNGYVIKVHVIMKFGVEMGKTAQEIQRRISDQIDKMTSSPVSTIDVVIEGVETEETQSKETNW